MNAFVMWTSIGSLATGGFLQLSMVVAQAVGTETEAGMYAAALSLATPATMLSSVLTILLFPAMAHATGRKDLGSVRRQTDAATRGIVTVLGAAFGVLILLAKPLVVIVFGTAFSDAIVLLPILLCASFVMNINVGAVNALLAGSRRTVRIPSILSGIGVLIGFAAMALLVPTLSVVGVAIGYLIGAIVAGSGPIIVVWKRKQMRWAALWARVIMGSLVVAALVAFEVTTGLGYVGDAIAAVAFLLAWLALMAPELRMIGSLRRRTAK
jgi:O-antigen/teichoic acid export membrane protein